MIYASYFTGTETTKKIVTTIAQTLDPNYIDDDFSSLNRRQTPLTYAPGDVVIFGVPVIAGRVPNLLLKYLDTIEGNGAFAVPIVLYGNRNFDDSLIELRDILEKGQLKTIAAGAFVGEHSFSKTLGKGRPDADDMEIARLFGRRIAKILQEGSYGNTPVLVDGTPYPYRGYYQPRDRKENPIDIRKVKPLTNAQCDDCKLCAEICPLGSIDFEQVSNISGICMKCCACVKRCPKGAKYYDDPGYLYHQQELEEIYQRRGNIHLYW
ncbi:MAG: ferredoxin [Anaerovoracaceae bacterium]